MITREEIKNIVWKRLRKTYNLDPTDKDYIIPNTAIGITIDVIRNPRFKVQDTRVLVITFPMELTQAALENLMDDIYDDFPSSFIKKIEPDIFIGKAEPNKIAVIVPENDVELIKEFFKGFEIEEKYNLYIAEEIK